MFTRKESILMFGAGVGAKRAHACVRHRCRVTAFVDNDRKKHGTMFLRRPVLAPSAIHRYPTHQIYVASMYADQIYRQLTLDLGVDPARIVIMKRPMLEGAYEVSPWTYATLGALMVAGLSVLGSAGYLLSQAARR